MHLGDDEYRLRVGASDNLYLIRLQSGDIWLVRNPPQGQFYPEDWDPRQDGGSAICLACESEGGQDLIELMEATATMLGAVTAKRPR